MAVRILPIILLVAGSSVCFANGESTPVGIDSVITQIEPIADTSDPYDLFERLTNLPHVTTRTGVVRGAIDDVLSIHDTLRPGVIEDVERSLRALGVLSTIDLSLDSGKSPSDPDFVVRTSDGWSLIAEFLDRPGDHDPIIILREENLVGTARSVGAGGTISSDSIVGRRWYAGFRDPRLFGTAHRFSSELIVDRLTTELRFTLEQPLLTFRQPILYGGTFTLLDGSQVYRFSDNRGSLVDGGDTVDSRRIRASAWVGSPNDEQDIFVGSVAIHAHFDKPSIAAETAPAQEPFANTIGLFAGIGSYRRQYRPLTGYTSTGQLLVPIGGAGSVSIGKFFSVDNGLDDVIYIGADARQTAMIDDLYLHASVAAGTGIRDREAELTSLQFGAGFGLPAGPGYLVGGLASRTIWRWPRYTFLPATRGSNGIRGYTDFDLFGDNRLVLNTEYRLFPVIDFDIWQIGFILFHDVAGVWNQGRPFSSVQFSNSLGAGIRVGHEVGIETGFLRIDVGWNFDRDEIGEISFGVGEHFDLFGSLEYRAPGPFLPE